MAIVAGVVVYAFGTGSSPTYITQTFVPMDLDKLSKESDLIVVGTVQASDTRSVEAEKISRAFTTTNINIERIIAGNYSGNTVLVTQLGDGKNIINRDAVELMEGEKVVLFLTHTGDDTIYGDAYVPIGGGQAKFSVGNDSVARSSFHGNYPVEVLIDEIQAKRQAN